MEFIMSGRFILGLIIGAVAYHFWMMRAKKSMG